MMKKPILFATTLSMLIGSGLAFADTAPARALRDPSASACGGSPGGARHSGIG